MTNSKELENVLGLSYTFKSKRAVKYKVAKHFLRDSSYLIDRFDLLINSDLKDSRNFRAKSFVDLMMSIECSFKSMIISLSKDPELPSKAYKKARKKEHYLDILYKEIVKRAKYRFKLPQKNDSILNDIKMLGIRTRYSYKLWCLKLGSTSKELFFDRDLISRTIDNSQWGLEVRNEAVKLNNLASSCLEKFLGEYSVLHGSKMKLLQKELLKFYSDLSITYNRST